MELDINQLRILCKKDNIRITVHAAKRLEQRGIRLADVMACIQNGKIIEQYPDDYPFPSCLILGLSVNNKYLHTVIGTDGKILFLITAYYPAPKEWDAMFEKRKEK